MGNEYHVTENAIIQCACGGKVSLSSSVTKHIIGGKKPLFWKDIIGAPVACPRSSKQNPCTVVQSISTAGTETNVGEQGELYLLRTDGFKTDKGRAVVLVDPGQHTSRICSIPTTENKTVQEEESTEVDKKKAKKDIHKEKYALYFLRRSEEIYKSLRPTRVFRDAEEIFLTKSGFLDIRDNIYVHTFAYMYIIQNGVNTEYKLLSKGSLYGEGIEDIVFENTKTKIKYNYIPIFEDSKIDISYSSMKLIDEKDIKKLKRLSVDPKQPDQKDYFYFKDASGINQNEITKKDLEIQKKFKQDKEGKQKRLNILCIIDDVLAEIEDMYIRYHTNYKLALAHNHTIIEDVKKNNSYTYTIANMVDVFYINDKQKAEAQKLKDIYHELVTLLLSDKSFINILLKENNLANILNKERFNIAKSYVQEVSYLNKDCLKDVVKNHADKNSFETVNKYIFTNSDVTKRTLKRQNTYKELMFHGTNLEFTKIQEDARILIAYLTFAIFFTNDYKEELQRSKSFDKLDNLRKKLYFLIKKMTPLPNIGSDNIRDIKKEIDKQKSTYKQITSKTDSLLEEYKYLDTLKKVYSFKQEDKNIKFKSAFIYSAKDELYKDSKLETPSKILKKIESKLKDEKLKELLKIYENISIDDEMSYTVICMNIVYLLSAPRIAIDEESEKVNIFKNELNHIYKFMVHLTDKRIALSEDQKDILHVEYGISRTYFEMQIKLLKYAYLEGKELKTNAQSFLKKYEKKEKKSYFLKLEDINDHLFDEEFKTKALIETMTQTLYTINGFSSNMIDILEKMKGEYQDKTKIPDSLKNFLDKMIEKRNLLKSTSTLIAFITLGLYIYNKDKNFGNTMSAVSDLVNLVKATTETILKHIKENKSSKNAQKILAKVFQDQRVQSISKTASTIATKVGIPLVVIAGTYESVKLLVDEDYDASIVSAIKTTLSVYLLLSVTLISFVALLILEILWYFFSHYVIDSDIEKYLIKSLLYKDIPFLDISYKNRSIWGKSYEAPYLFETTNQKKELKAISSDGFNKHKKLISFIAENYKGNEKYFDTSLRNELNFFKSSLFGYKLEKTKYKSHQRVRTITGIEISFYVQKALKIPKILVEDDNFELYFFPYGDEYFKFEGDLIEEKDYYIFDFFPEKNPYIFLNSFTNKIKKANHKSNIIVISSQIELKYEVEFRDNDKITPNCYIDIASLKQISFSPEDEELLKGKE